MNGVAENITTLKTEIPSQVKLVAVSKKKSVADMLQAYHAGQRLFGENYVQEITTKVIELPDDIEWHFIGHLQTNKVKYIAPFVHWIHGVESEKLLAEINKQAAKNNRKINCLLQVHIAEEETKFGFSTEEILGFCRKIDFSQYDHCSIRGLMGMATFTEDLNRIRSEFKLLKTTFDLLKQEVFTDNENFCELSMGMSADWKIAVEEGSTMVRIGSSIFGIR